MTFEQYYTSTLHSNIGKARTRAKERDDRWYDNWVAKKADEPYVVSEYIESNLSSSPEPMSEEAFETAKHDLMVGLGEQNLISDANLTIVIDFNEVGDNGRVVIKERAWDTVDVYWREGDGEIQSVRLHDKVVQRRTLGKPVNRYEHQHKDISLCGHSLLVSGLGLKAVVFAK